MAAVVVANEDTHLHLTEADLVMVVIDCSCGLP